MNANVVMQVVTTKQFGDMEIQVYENPAVDHARPQDDFWMTREQIGAALEYKNPSISIGTIHKRNAKRLDPLSGLINLITPGGKQQTYVYNMRGVMEICRYSTQPKADAFMDFCWDVLYTQLPKLLNEFVKRSLQEKNSESEEAMKDYKIFISYSEDSKNTVNRIKKVSAYLRQKGYTVWCYADEPLGVNVVTFMQKAPEADVILVMGSKNYKEKSLLIDEKGSGSGVFFENLVLSQMFIYNKMKKIVPIAFEQGTSFEDSFPPPFSTNKGLCGYRVTTKFLENLAKQINNTLMKLEANK